MKSRSTLANPARSTVVLFAVFALVLGSVWTTPAGAQTDTGNFAELDTFCRQVDIATRLQVRLQSYRPQTVQAGEVLPLTLHLHNLTQSGTTFHGVSSYFVLYTNDEDSIPARVIPVFTNVSISPGAPKRQAFDVDIPNSLAAGEYVGYFYTTQAQDPSTVYRNIIDRQLPASQQQPLPIIITPARSEQPVLVLESIEVNGQRSVERTATFLLADILDEGNEVAVSIQVRNPYTDRPLEGQVEMALYQGFAFGTDEAVTRISEPIILTRNNTTTRTLRTDLETAVSGYTVAVTYSSEQEPHPVILGWYSLVQSPELAAALQGMMPRQSFVGVRDAHAITCWQQSRDWPMTDRYQYEWSLPQQLEIHTFTNGQESLTQVIRPLYEQATRQAANYIGIATPVERTGNLTVLTRLSSWDDMLETERLVQSSRTTLTCAMYQDLCPLPFYRSPTFVEAAQTAGYVIIFFLVILIYLYIRRRYFLLKRTM